MLKLYRAEPKRPLVRACLAPSDDLLISEFVGIEFISAAYGLVRQSIISHADANTLIAAFEADKPNYIILLFEASVSQEVERLLRTYTATISLRPMDALHLPTALVEHRRQPLDSFITTDKVLISVAQTEGLVVKP